MPGIAKPKIQAFAQEYVENGMNGTKAILALKPDLPVESAGVAASRMLKDDNVQRAIADYSAGVKEKFETTLSIAIAQCNTWLTGDDAQLKLYAMKWVIEMAKAFAPSQKQPSQSKHVHINVPKR